MLRYGIDIGHIRDFVEEASSEADAIAQEIAVLEAAILSLKSGSGFFIWEIPGYKTLELE